MKTPDTHLDNLTRIIADCGLHGMPIEDCRSLATRIEAYLSACATADWLAKQFAMAHIFTQPQNSYFGIPVHVVEHLAYGFIEAEMTDGTRQIIKLKQKPQKEPERNTHYDSQGYCDNPARGY